jgi:hypothetical protein
MDLARIRTAIEEAISVSAQSVRLPGIVDAAARTVAVTSSRLTRVEEIVLPRYAEKRSFYPL